MHTNLSTLEKIKIYLYIYVFAAAVSDHLRCPLLSIFITIVAEKKKIHSYIQQNVYQNMSYKYRWYGLPQCPLDYPMGTFPKIFYGWNKNCVRKKFYGNEDYFLMARANFYIWICMYILYICVCVCGDICISSIVYLSQRSWQPARAIKDKDLFQVISIKWNEIFFFLPYFLQHVDYPQN